MSQVYTRLPERSLSVLIARKDDKWVVGLLGLSLVWNLFVTFRGYLGVVCNSLFGSS